MILHDGVHSFHFLKVEKKVNTFATIAVGFERLTLL